MSTHSKPWYGFTGIDSPRYVLCALHPISRECATASAPTLNEARQWAADKREIGYEVEATYMDQTMIRSVSDTELA